MTKPTWIHVGYPKCASTSLQKDFFSQCPSIDYAGRWKDWDPSTSEIYLGPSTQIASLEEVYYQQKKQELAEAVQAEFTHPERPIRMISNESFTAGNLPYFKSSPRIDNGIIANRLADVFPNAQILMVLRNQIDWLVSLYAQLARFEPFAADINTIIQSQLEHHAASMGSTLHMVDYWSLYQHYQHVFGADNVHVVLMEDLAREPEATMDSLIRLLGLPDEIQAVDYLPNRHNARRAPTTPTRLHGILRKTGILQVGSKMARLGPASFQEALRRKLHRKQAPMALTAKTKKICQDYYRQGNQQLQQMVFGGQPTLQEAGYPV